MSERWQEGEGDTIFFYCNHLDKFFNQVKSFVFKEMFGHLFSEFSFMVFLSWYSKVLPDDILIIFEEPFQSFIVSENSINCVKNFKEAPVVGLKNIHIHEFLIKRNSFDNLWKVLLNLSQKLNQKVKIEFEVLYD